MWGHGTDHWMSPWASRAGGTSSSSSATVPTSSTTDSSSSSTSPTAPSPMATDSSSSSSSPESPLPTAPNESPPRSAISLEDAVVVRTTSAEQNEARRSLWDITVAMSKSTVTVALVQPDRSVLYRIPLVWLLSELGVCANNENTKALLNFGGGGVRTAPGLPASDAGAAVRREAECPAVHSAPVLSTAASCPRPEPPCSSTQLTLDRRKSPPPPPPPRASPRRRGRKRSLSLGSEPLAKLPAPEQVLHVVDDTCDMGMVVTEVVISGGRTAMAGEFLKAVTAAEAVSEPSARIPLPGRDRLGPVYDLGGDLVDLGPDLCPNPLDLGLGSLEKKPQAVCDHCTATL
ncbi:hypothetical protein FOCC_FOCC010979 [Frankliniella occidentalis]|nr:hypothetical protein FOCC_FOCC010979 [Frankliniella occidentalis]